MTRRQSEAGFAQILVIAALAVLAAVMTAAVSMSRLGAQQISALDARVVADVTLDSGLRLLRAALDDPDDDLEVRAMAAPVTTRIGDEQVELAIAGEGGKIDVLRSDMSLVERFSRNAGLNQDELAQLVTAPSDRRAVGDDVGAMDAVQLALAAAVGFAAIEESFTRFGSDRIDPAFASLAVLRAIPDLGDAEARRIAATSSSERAPYTALSRYFASGSRRFMLIAKSSAGARGTFERRLPIELTNSGGVIELDRPR